MHCRTFFHAEWTSGLHTYLSLKPGYWFASWGPCQASKTISGCQVPRYPAEAPPTKKRNRYAISTSFVTYARANKVIWPARSGYVMHIWVLITYVYRWSGYSQHWWNFWYIQPWPTRLLWGWTGSESGWWCETPDRGKHELIQLNDTSIYPNFSLIQMEKKVEAGESIDDLLPKWSAQKQCLCNRLT